MDVGWLERDIEALGSAVASAGSGHRVDWRAVWSDIKAIGAGFKDTRFADRDAREEAWSRFQAIVRSVKDQQARQHERREQLASGSSRHLDRIRNMTDAAVPDSGLGRMMLTLFTGGLNVIAEDAMDALFGRQDEVYAELHRRSAILREACQ
jgi:hypothetical protein